MTSGHTDFNSWMAVQSKSHFHAGSLNRGLTDKKKKDDNTGMRKLTRASHVQNKVVHC